jgi:hypothetical protein
VLDCLFGGVLRHFYFVMAHSNPRHLPEARHFPESKSVGFSISHVWPLACMGEFGRPQLHRESSVLSLDTKNRSR